MYSQPLSSRGSDRTARIWLHALIVVCLCLRPVALCGDAAHPMMPNLGQGGCQSTEDGYRLGAELATVSHTREVPSALARYSRVRVVRTAIVQGFAQLGSDLLVDFDLMMTIPLLGPFFLAATQLSMPWILRFLYTPEF
mmetsp:Transcript_40360/g.118250  ORF Transcript_40360/g.118250 Transcript_40360/m.118250 type:complete len:139 (+) Transcript_40360:1621-2037(+)